MFLLALGADLLIFAGPQDPFEFSAASFEAALALQEQVTDDWLAREGVVGTAIGVDGRGHAVLKVYVTSIAAVAGFPQYMVGVEVVTEVTGPFLALGDMPVPADAEAVDPKKNFPRPVPIGVSTGHPSVTAGTIGARVTDGSRVFAPSNNHIFAANNGGKMGDTLLPPGRVARGPDPAPLPRQPRGNANLGRFLGDGVMAFCAHGPFLGRTEEAGTLLEYRPRCFQ